MRGHAWVVSTQAVRWVGFGLTIPRTSPTVEILKIPTTESLAKTTESLSSDTLLEGMSAHLTLSTWRAGEEYRPGKRHP